MNILYKIAIAIVVLLSLAAGAAKIMQAPQEAAFFEAVGLAPIFMIGLGVLQVLGGILIAIPKSRRMGAIVAALSFLVSVVMIVKTGQVGFALVSLLPVMLALFVFVRSKSK